MSNSPPNQNSVQPIVRVAPLGELKIYQISQSELETLASGGPESLLLNFSLFFCSSFLSFFITLTSTELKSDRLFLSFLTICLVSAIASAIFGALWLKSRTSTRSLRKEIENRMPPPPGVQEKN